MFYISLPTTTLNTAVWRLLQNSSFPTNFFFIFVHECDILLLVLNKQSSQDFLQKQKERKGKTRTRWRRVQALAEYRTKYSGFISHLIFLGLLHLWSDYHYIQAYMYSYTFSDSTSIYSVDTHFLDSPVISTKTCLP